VVAEYGRGITKFSTEVKVIRDEISDHDPFSAQVIDTGGVIVKTLVSEIFAKPTEADVPLGGFGILDHQHLSEEEGAADMQAPELAMVEN